MITGGEARRIALAFEESVELPHFERTSFRVRKKIFATMDEKQGIVVVMLTPLEQSAFLGFGDTAVYPVPGGWGAKGATIFNLKTADKEMLKDAITVAYCLKAPVKLAEKYK